MNCKIPFVKEIDFGKKVHEITSISLEHDYKLEDVTLVGNFIVSGDFKSHEVSVNKEPFSYILPFEIDLNDDVDKDTIEFMIDDFNYEVVEDTKLKVNIDFSVIASNLQKTDESIFVDSSNAFNDLPDVYYKDDEEVEDKQVEELKEERIIDSKVEDKDIDEEQREIIEVKEKSKEEDIEVKLNENTIMNNVSKEEEYATYHIHMVAEGETVETICTMYNSNIFTLGLYNDLNNILPGDKIIVPDNLE